jgi:predicted nucleic acid-binding protein
MMTTAAIDTSVVVALTDAHDKWHAHAVALRDALLASGIRQLYFDCVINEAIGVVGRRAEEQRRSEEFERLLDGLLILIPAQAITWISGAGERLLPEILALCRQHQGKLNYHDALIALACRELDIRVIVSFDGDLDGIAWLERVLEPESVSRLAGNP